MFKSSVGLSPRTKNLAWYVKLTVCSCFILHTDNYFDKVLRWLLNCVYIWKLCFGHFSQSQHSKLAPAADIEKKKGMSDISDG